MDIVFDYFSITLLIGGFAAFLSGIVVFLRNRRQMENQAWLALNISSAVWSFAYFSMIVSQTHDRALFSNYVLHAAAILIPIFYFVTILAVTKTYREHMRSIVVVATIGLLLLLVNPSSYFVRDVLPKGPFAYAPDAGPIYIFFTIFFFAIVIHSLWIVFREHKKTRDPIQRGRLHSIILFTLAGFGGGGSVFFLTFNIPIAPYPLILFSLYPVISGYAIFKYQLFDTKVLTTQLVTFALWIFILIRVILSDTFREQVINGSLFMLMVVFGFILIRSVQKEVATRERIESLAKDLAKANERLKELDGLKSEFLSIASHQIRAPITAIKGYASLIMEENFGKISPELKSAVEVIFESSKSMAIMVDDFLNISRIEQGRMKYDLAVTDMSTLATQVVDELKPTVEKKGLTISLSFDKKANFEARIDAGKIKQAVTNLVDNAVKYTPKGSISVNLARSGGKIDLAVKDTGMGISAENIPKLFQKFSRAKDAISTNVSGTGLGLYVVKQMVEGHEGGKVWVESPGEGKGSTFHVEVEAFEKR